MVCSGSEDMASKLLRETKSMASHVTETRLWLRLRLEPGPGIIFKGPPQRPVPTRQAPQGVTVFKIIPQVG